MTLRQLKWLTILAPLLFLAAIEILRQIAPASLFHAWPGYLLLAGIFLLGALFFAEAVFGVVGRLQDRLAHQNHELLALHEAGLEILGEIELETVLQRVVDRARALVGARYGAISLLGVDGAIEEFLTSGLTRQERESIGPPPVGHGLLGVVISDGVALRLADLTRDPRSVGFPDHHPLMRSLLAVPIVSHGDVLGNLYLTENEVDAEFSRDDEETLVRFATVAALAIENARLHRRVRAMAITEEREWIAREMHDNLAQVLGYVNAKAQAAQVLLTDGQPDRAAMHLSQLAEAARSAYADVREGILGLRTSLAGEKEFVETLEEYLRSWREQSGLNVSLIIVPPDRQDSGLTPTAEVQLLRIVQEALANVRKHAVAHSARIAIRHGSNSVEVEIEDDGAGFAPDALGRTDHPRFGLSTMKERAEAVGGTFAIISAPGTGTRVRVCLPYDSVQHTQREGTRRAGAHR
ncbi:MAG: GAF domain-containing sensor histidine kinase [Thermomicrobiales bacterium]